MDGLIKLLIDNQDRITFSPRCDWMQALAGIAFEQGGNMQICGRNACAVVWLNGCITRALAAGRDLMSFDNEDFLCLEPVTSMKITKK